MDKRIVKLRSFMEENRLDGFFVSKAENIYYLSGFSGGNDGKLLITPDEKYIFSDGRYTEQLQRECPDWNYVQGNTDYLDRLNNIGNKYTRLGIEAHDLSYSSYRKIQEKLGPELVAYENIIEKQRMIKDESELNYLRESAHISDRVFLEIQKIIKIGMSERKVASYIGFYLRNFGCSKESFDTIAVAGSNAALPHGQPGDKVLQKGDMLTLDFGGFFQGYSGDMTRTVAIEEATPRLRENYQRVLEAQELGVAAVKAGVCCKDIDLTVRKCLEKHNLERYFNHGTGHGLGLEIHEEPRVSTKSDTILTENMVITIEPGIYIPEWGGIRIEDTVIVKNGGCERITHSDKGLLIL